MRKTVWLLLIVFVVTGCKNKNAYPEGFSQAASGFYYKIVSAAGNNNDSILKGDVVKVQLQQFIDDSLLNSTYTKVPDYIKIDDKLNAFDYTGILIKMKTGDSAVCIFKTEDIIKKSGIKENIPAFLQKGKEIKIYFKIAEKFTADSIAVTDYNAAIKRADSNYKKNEAAGLLVAALQFDSLIATIKTPLLKLPNGVYLQIQQKGNGVKLQKGAAVSVLYTGRLVNGTVFEETESGKPFSMHADEGEAIEGFDKAVATLSTGDKARLYIPAALAYRGKTKNGKLPAFSNLIFDVQIAEASKSEMPQPGKH
jgi:FKBP-type peptidyl-prolyl cis-trans isomerase FkpA